MAEKHIAGLIVQLQMERDWLRARLEVRKDGGPDGIECRDQTIRMLDQEIDRLRAEVEKLKVIISQWYSVYTDDMPPDGDLLADTDAALCGEGE